MEKYCFNLVEVEKRHHISRRDLEIMRLAAEQAADAESTGDGRADLRPFLVLFLTKEMEWPL